MSSQSLFIALAGCWCDSLKCVSPSLSSAGAKRADVSVSIFGEGK